MGDEPWARTRFWGEIANEPQRGIAFLSAVVLVAEIGAALPTRAS